ncbi:MAG: hypothetical protein ABSH35_14420 [Isosphaeraceae bacterium]
MTHDDRTRLKAPGWLVRVLPGLTAVVLVVLLHPDLARQLPYPSGKDQELYLLSGRDFAEDFTFQPRAPLYGAWVGLFYAPSHGDLSRCFVLEKYATTILFVALTAYAVYAQSGLRAALVTALVAAYNKYVVFEDNGSTIFAAALVAASLIALRIRRSSVRYPVASLLLFLTTLVHPMMTAVFLAAMLYLVARTVVAAVKDPAAWRHEARSAVVGWMAAFTVMALLVGLANARPSRTPSNYTFFITFRHAFTLTYAKRYYTEERIREMHVAGLDKAFEEILPSVETFEDVVRRCPAQILAHVAYNARQTVVALPATLLGLTNCWLVGAVVLIYLLAEFLQPYRRGWASGLLGTADQAAWLASVLFVIPPMVGMMVWSRYLVPVIPVALVTCDSFLTWLVNRLSPRSQAEREHVKTPSVARA